MQAPLTALEQTLHDADPWRRQFRFLDTRAAVAVILRENGDGLEVLLTRRTPRDGDPWSGHVAFPGGLRDEGDPDDLATAVRETDEEIGLALDREQCLGRLPAWLTRTHTNWMPMAVVPWVFHWQGPAECTLNHEVAEVFWVPIHALRNPQNAARRSWNFAGVSWSMHGWDWQGRIIWGLTYHMLRSLLRQIDE